MDLGRWRSLPDSERRWWLARYSRRRSLHSCGHSPDVCGDESREWFPQMTVCRADMEREAAQAAYARKREKRPWHDGSFKKWAEEPSRSFPYHYLHGTTIWVSLEDHGEGGDFLG